MRLLRDQLGEAFPTDPLLQDTIAVVLALHLRCPWHKHYFKREVDTAVRTVASQINCSESKLWNAITAAQAAFHYPPVVEASPRPVDRSLHDRWYRRQDTLVWVDQRSKMRAPLVIAEQLERAYRKKKGSP